MDSLLITYLSMLFADAQQALEALSPALRNLVFRTLTRQEELEGPRDQWGNWEFSFSSSHREGLTFVPWIDEQVLKEVQLPRRSLWPDGKRFAVCITHDVDCLTGVPSLSERVRKMAALVGSPEAETALTDHALMGAGLLKAMVRHLGGRRGGVDFQELIAFEASLGFFSTFYFIAEHKRMPHLHDCFYRFEDQANWDGQAASARDVMRHLQAAGWDVGVHGSFHSATRAAILAQEKSQVEQVIGVPVVSCRQHYLHFESKVTPDLQAEAGFRLDSTHGFNRTIGFRSGTCFPYPLFSASDQAPLSVLEMPQHVMDGALFKPNGLEYPEALATEHVLDLMDKVERVGGVLTLSWHPDQMDQHPEWRRVFEAVLREAHRRNAYGCSMRQLLERISLPQ